MEDRELAKTERELRGYLSARLDRIPVHSVPNLAPPADGWVRRAAVLPATIFAILLAIAAGVGLAEWRASRTPDQSQATSGVPGPLALAGGSPSAAFGFVSTSANTLFVRSEVTETAALTIGSALPQVAVSPNGHEIAYWGVLPNRQNGQALYELFRSDLIDANARDRLVMAAPNGEVPGPVVWSSDGTGLIANTHTAPSRGPLASSPTMHMSWFAIDLTAGKVTELAPGFEGVVTTVYAWDRQRDLITGSGFYAGQNAFSALRSGRITTNAIPTGSTLVAADAFGRSLVISHAGSCKGPLLNTDLSCPILESRDQATFAPIASSPVGDATRGIPDVTFRPRSQDLIVQLPLPNGDARVEVWGDLGRGPHQVLASYTQSVRFTGRRELIVPRADGSAVFLLKFDDSAGGRWFGEIVSFAPDTASRGLKDPQRTPFEILTGGNPLASVVLDPTFAKAMEPSRSASASRAPAPTLSTSAEPVGYVPSNACTAVTFNRANDGGSARWTFTCRGLMTWEAWREGLRRSAVDQGWRETTSQSEVLEFVRDDLGLAMTIEARPSDGAFALTQRVVRPSAEAIRAVLESPTGAAFAQYPKTISAQPCEIRGGGPSPGILIPGTCRTEAEPTGSSYRVSFTFVWDAGRFHLAGEPSSGELHHTWSFILDASGAVLMQPDSGNFPPQYVR
jgi:hypothetical protein